MLHVASDARLVIRRLLRSWKINGICEKKRKGKRESQFDYLLQSILLVLEKDHSLVLAGRVGQQCR
jgi:hypothetical protein